MGKRKNGFVIYFEQYMDKQRKAGRSISKKIAVDECGPKWRALSDDERQVFIDLANDYKCEKLKMKKEYFQNLDTENKSNEDLKYLTSVIDSEKALKNHKFYLIHTNYYCKTAEALYVPAELAIAEFNLKNGVLRTFHKLIDPGEVPLGYAYDAKRNSDEVHGLPLPPYDEGDKNFDAILDSIMQFMEPSKQETGSYAPFFTVERNMSPTINVLDNITTFKFGENSNDFVVYPIHKMLFWVKNKCSECSQSSESGFPVLSNAWTEIERDVFRYCTGISCEFHRTCPDKYHNCSLSVVQRLAYVICDHCCRYMDIELLRGKHVPLNFKKDKEGAFVVPRKEACAKSLHAGTPDRHAGSAHASSSAASSSSAPSAWPPAHVDDAKRDANEQRGDPRLQSRSNCDDDDFSSDDDLFVTIGRGKVLSTNKKSENGHGSRSSHFRHF